MTINLKNNSENHTSAKRLTQISRRISNRANYIMRKDLFSGRKPNQSKVDKLLKTGKISESDIELYQRLPAAVSQRTIQIVGDNWSSFAKAKADWKKSPAKYIAMPRPPKYVKSAKTVYIPVSSFKVHDSHIVFAKTLGLLPVNLGEGNFPNQTYNAKAATKIINEVRLVPTGSHFKLEIIYDKSRASGFLPSYTQNVLLDKSSFVTIDLGLSIFAALVSNQAGLSPLLINGGELKRINQWYNKRCAELRSLGKYGHLGAVSAKRNRRVKDKLHKISIFLVNYCLEHDIGTVIVGKNKQWKTGINIGKRNNQNFVNIPHAQFISILCYKLKEIGIKLIEQEESYTSKASFVDNDTIPTYGEDEEKPIFSGRRVKRGSYLSSNGTLLHADLNGAGNIARKAGYEGASLVTGGAVNAPILIGL
jgi:putative transposase